MLTFLLFLLVFLLSVLTTPTRYRPPVSSNASTTYDVATGRTHRALKASARSNRQYVLRENQEHLTDLYVLRNRIRGDRLMRIGLRSLIWELWVCGHNPHNSDAWWEVAQA